MRQRFIISGRLNGMNEYQSACRSFWAKGRDMKRRDQDTVIAAIKAASIEPYKRAVRIKYTFYEMPKRKGAKLRDNSNIAAFAVKVIEDALQEAGVIENDNWNWIAGYSCEFYRSSANPRIIVEMEEA